MSGGEPNGDGAAAATQRSRALETGYVGLDLIRFGAALMIVFYHLVNIGPARLGAAGLPFRESFAAVHQVVAAFWVAVPVFFVLSGAVIAFSAEGRSAGEFVRRRALRLYPAAWICASITALVVWTHWPQPDLGARYLRSIALFPDGPWISDVYWTMAVEVTFYAMTALALALGGPGSVVRLGLGLALLSAAWWALRIGNWLAGGAFEPLVAGVRVADAFLLLRNGCFFALGILLYALASGRRSRRLAAAAALAAFASLANVFTSARGFVPPGGGGLFQLLLPPAIWSAGLALIVLSLAREKAMPPLPARWRGGMRTLGLATYPLYLVHAELGMAIMLLLAPLGPVFALAAALMALLAVVLLILRAETAIRRLLRGRRGTTSDGAPRPR